MVKYECYNMSLLCRLHLLKGADRVKKAQDGSRKISKRAV